jgi:type 1 fimbriae regulatory protein FimE
MSKTQNGTVKRRKVKRLPPKRLPYEELRPREYLTEEEVKVLMAVAKARGRYGQRDATMILLTYRHGLRVSELCALRWNQVDFKQGLLHVHRLKNGIDSVHPLRGPELRALRRLERETDKSAYLFITERGGPMTSAGFRKMLYRTAEASSLSFSVHPHMLRHGCGFKLANDGQDTRAVQHYLGHKNIQHTVRYTELTPKRFNNFWND